MAKHEQNYQVYLLFALVTVGAALGNLSQTGMNAMLTSAMDEFGLGVDAGQWLTTAFGTFLAVGSIACVLINETTPLWLLSVFQTIRAIGVSGLIGPLLTFSLSGLKGPIVAHGSSAMVIIRQVAGTFGTAIMVLCVTISSSAGAAGAIPYQIAFAFAAAMAVLSLATIVVRVR